MTAEELAGENGLLKKLTSRFYSKALDAEMDEHLGYKKNDNAGDNSGNSRNSYTSNKQPVSWRQNFTEEETLLCALDRIFDDSLIFNFNGDSHRGLKREVISLTTKKIKALQS